MSWHGKHQIESQRQHGGARVNPRVCDNLKSTIEDVRNEIHSSECYEDFGEDVRIEMGIIQDGESIIKDSHIQNGNNEGTGSSLLIPVLSSSSPLSLGRCCFETSSKLVEEDVLDAQKVDEWLKNRSDSLSSIEFENEIKQEEVEDEYEFVEGGNGATSSKTNQLSDFFAKNGPHIEQNYQQRSSFINNNTRNQLKTIVSGHNNGNVSKLNQCRPLSATKIPTIKDVFSIEASKYEESFPQVGESILSVLKVGNHSSNRTLVDNCDNDNACDSDGPIFGDDLSGFCETTKDIMLMTPQELERMPESGLEFEESVGPREFDMLCKQEEEEEEEDDEVEEEDDEKEQEIEKEEMEVDKCQPSVVPPSSSCTNTETTPPSSALATISISTDKMTNTTSIVINTKQGQQSFKINTANLMQAAATLHPLTIADLVERQNREDSLEMQNVEGGGSSEDKDRNEDLERAHNDDDTEPKDAEAQDSKPSLFGTTACAQEEGLSSGICTHIGRCKKVWTCPEPQCGKEYAKQSKLKVHMMMHSKLRPFKCEVDGCDWAFTTIYKLKRHLETHCSMKDYVCDHEDCNRRFTTIYNLKSHKRLHTQPKSVKCPIEKCASVFPTRRKMELHIKEHRDIEAPYKCPVESCNKAYYTTNSMASHLRSHKKSRFQCLFDGCGAEFDKMSRFKVHMWRHTGERPYACTYEGCNWAFSSASKLNRHSRKHTGERRYTCKEPNCGKSFMRLEHLQGHSVTHSGDKPYVCHHENCDARFTAKSSLYVHLKKHDGRAGKIVYPCPADSCDKKYNCKSSLRIHMLRYHETKLEMDYGHVEYITLLAKDDLQDATMTVDQFGQTVTPTGELPFDISKEPKTVEDVMAVNPVEVVAQQIDNLPIATSVLPTTELLVPASISGVVSTPIATILSDLPTTVTDPPSLTNSEVIVPSPTDMDMMVTSRVLQENNSGSARTDYCCNYMKRKYLQQRRNEHRQARLDTVSTSATSDSSSRKPRRNATTTSTELATTDVVLTSTAITYRDSVTGVHFIQTPLLQDDPPSSHSDLYQEDGLLTSMANSLSLPISLLVDQSVSHPNSAQGPDFCSSSSTVAEFTGTTINLQDLE